MAGALHAQAPTSSDTLLIEADRPARVGDVVVGDFAGSYQRIDADELARGATGIGDVLANETGVQHRQSGGFGTYSTITLRAGTPAQTGIFLDGVRLNGAGDAALDLSTLDLLNLGAIEIFRGAMPASLGGGAIGGAVNLSTPRHGDAPAATRIALGAGSFGSATAELAHRSRRRATDIVATLSARHSDNRFRFRDSNGTPLNPDDDTRQTRQNADATRLALLASIARGTLDRGRRSLLVQASSRSLGVPEWRNNPDNDARLHTDALQLQGAWQQRASASAAGAAAWSRHHTAYANAQRQRFDDADSDVGLGAQDNRDDLLTLGMNTYWERFVGAGTVGLRAELRQDSLDSEDRLQRRRDFSAERRSAALTGEWAWYSSDDRWVVTPSLHATASRDDYRRITRNDRSNRRETSLSPQLAVRHDASPTLSWYASVGEYFREPSFAELFGNQGLVRGNNDLQAERGTNAEIGIDWQVRRNWTTRASVFASRREELITTVYDTRGIGRSINAGGADVLGIELGSQWRHGKHWLARLNATVQDAVADSDVAAFDNRQLPGEARSTLFARLQYRWDSHWLLWLEADGRWQRFYDQANVLPAKDQWLQNVGIDWQRADWQASLSVTNLGNDTVEDFNGFPRPGRSVFVNVTFNL